MALFTQTRGILRLMGGLFLIAICMTVTTVHAEELIDPKFEIHYQADFSPLYASELTVWSTRVGKALQDESLPTSSIDVVDQQLVIRAENIEAVTAVLQKSFTELTEVASTEPNTVRYELVEQVKIRIQKYSLNNLVIPALSEHITQQGYTLIAIDAMTTDRLSVQFQAKNTQIKLTIAEAELAKRLADSLLEKPLSYLQIHPMLMLPGLQLGTGLPASQQTMVMSDEAVIDSHHVVNRLLVEDSQGRATTLRLVLNMRGVEALVRWQQQSQQQEGGKFAAIMTVPILLASTEWQTKTVVVGDTVHLNLSAGTIDITNFESEEYAPVLLQILQQSWHPITLQTQQASLVKP